MYNTKATITGLEETAIYPIVVGVATDILNFLGLKDTVPVRIGENPPLLITKDTVGQNKHIPDILDEELRIEYTETGGEDYDISLASMAAVTNAIYRDTEIRSSIRPLLSRKTLIFNITYYAKSKSKVTSVMNRLRARNPSDTRHRYHDLEYFYYLPPIIIELLDTLNTLKNTYQLPVVDLDDYVANTFNTQANIINSETGNPLKSGIGLRECQQMVLGTVDTDVYSVTKDKDDESNRWSFVIDYSIDFELPNQLLVNYPLTVYNQPIPAKFRLSNKVAHKHTGNRTGGEGGLSDITTRDNELLRISDGEYYLKIPREDSLVLPEPELSYVRLFSVISVIDIANPNTLFYLDEIPGITIKPEVLELMKLEASRIGDTHTSIFYLDIYNHNDKLYSHKVILTAVTEIINGISVDRVKISTNLPLDIRGSYRVCLNILTDLTSLRTGALSLLKQNIAIVDAVSLTGFSVIDSIVGVLNLDTTKLRTDFAITDTTTGLDIALNISNNLWNRVYTKQTSLILTEMLESK